MSNKNYNQILQTNNTSLEDIITQLNNLPDAGEGGIDTSDATAAAADILAGKTAYVDGNKITGTIPFTAQATPSITVNSSGLITATATQTAGYVTAGTKSATKQLAFQAAKTITPGTTNQTAVAANTYVGGAITVKGDSNLIAGNIKKGTSIFGVTGNYEGSGGDTSIEDELIIGDFTTYTNDRVTSIGQGAFMGHSKLTSVNFPNCMIINGYTFPGAGGNIGAFALCSSLTTINFPACISIGSNTFYRCSSLTSISFPVCSYIGNNAFCYCTSLTSVSFPACRIIGSYAFSTCSSLTSISFPVCSYIGSSAFSTCYSLTSVSFPNCSYIGGSAFYSCSRLALADFGNSTSTSCTFYPLAFNRCSKLTTLILRYGSVITLSNVNAFASTPMSVSTLTGAFGSIYVPASLVAAYKSATNWATYANRITAIAE